MQEIKKMLQKRSGPKINVFPPTTIKDYILDVQLSSPLYADDTIVAK